MSPNSNILSYAHLQDKKLDRLVISFMESLSGRSKVKALYEQLDGLHHPSIWAEALRLLEIRLQISNVEYIPKDGPIVVIANHPFGILDGLILGKMLADTRDDFSILVNKALCVHKEVDRFCLPIDFADSKEAIRNNIRTKQMAIERLVSGEAIGIFPSGGVATAQRPFRKAEELEWKRFVIKLIDKAKAPVLPVFFEGQNSALFHFASKLHASLRLGLLIHELKNKMNSTIQLQVRRPIPYTKLAAIDRKERLTFLEQITMHDWPTCASEESIT